jgi:hypothetical protein
MSNKFLASAINAVNRHGLSLVYSVITAGGYDVETGTNTLTKQPYTVKMYPKHFIANNYNYPALIGKETCMFYLPANALSFVPKLLDEISYNNKVYQVNSYQEHVANGEIVLYRIIALRG